MGTSLRSDPISSALFGATRRAVLAVLFSDPDRAFYVRELIRLTDVGQGTVQRELARLEKAGLVERRRQGCHVYYQASRKSPVFEELRSLVAKTAGLSGILGSSLGPLSNAIELAFVYGSQASGEATASSDIDLLVVGDVDELALHRALRAGEAAAGRTVNYTLLSKREFDRRGAEPGGFIERVLAGPKIWIVSDTHAI